MAAPAGMHFLTSRRQWNDYVLLVCALTCAAGLLGSAATCLGSPISPPPPGAGIALLVPGGLFELAFPLLFIVRSSSGRPDASLVPVSAGGAG